jgi:hypothetical protein
MLRLKLRQISTSDKKVSSFAIRLVLLNYLFLGVAKQHVDDIAIDEYFERASDSRLWCGCFVQLYGVAI